MVLNGGIAGLYRWQIILMLVLIISWDFPYLGIPACSGRYSGIFCAVHTDTWKRILYKEGWFDYHCFCTLYYLMLYCGKLFGPNGEKFKSYLHDTGTGVYELKQEYATQKAGRGAFCFTGIF